MQGIHRKIEKAIDRLNTLRGKPYLALGAYYYADVRGDGIFRPRVYVSLGPDGGLGEAYDFSRNDGLTYTGLLQRIEDACAALEAAAPAPITSEPGFDGRKS